METNEDLAFPIFELTTGDFGLVKTKARLTDVFFNKTSVIDKRIERFSMDGEPLVEINIISSINNINEELYLKPKIIIDGFEWSIVLHFLKRSNDYFFAGKFGHYGNLNERYTITADIYIKTRNRVIEFCNPECIYSIDNIISLLNDSESPEINEWLSLWREAIINRQNSNENKK